MKNESWEKWEKKKAFSLLHFLIPHAYDAHSFLVDWWGLTPRSSIATAQEEQRSVLTFRERTRKRHIFQPAAPNAPRSQLLSHCIAHLLTPFKRVQLSGVSLSLASPGAFSRNYIALTLDCEKAEKKKRTREKLQLLAYVHVLYLYSKSKEKIGSILLLIQFARAVESTQQSIDVNDEHCHPQLSSRAHESSLDFPPHSIAVLLLCFTFSSAAVLGCLFFLFFLFARRKQLKLNRVDDESADVVGSRRWLVVVVKL